MFQGVLNDVKERIQTIRENLADRVNKTLDEGRHTGYILDM